MNDFFKKFNVFKDARFKDDSLQIEICVVAKNEGGKGKRIEKMSEKNSDLIKLAIFFRGSMGTFAFMFAFGSVIFRFLV